MTSSTYNPTNRRAADRTRDVLKDAAYKYFRIMGFKPCFFEIVALAGMIALVVLVGWWWQI